MQLLDSPSTADTPANIAISKLNHSTYAALKLMLSLRLRRQVILAVCDDLMLRDTLAARLQTELCQGSHPEMPYLVSLTLDVHDPNPFGQIAAWLTHHGSFPYLRGFYGFQILGVERLTRQPALAQSQFLNRLRSIDQYQAGRESTLLLWLPRPWLRMVQRSAPEFWEWHTALFEFAGDPTPVPSDTRVISIDQCPELDLSKSIAPERSLPGASLELPPLSPSLQENLRTILTQDLAQLDRHVQPVAMPAPPIPQPVIPASVPVTEVTLPDVHKLMPGWTGTLDLATLVAATTGAIAASAGQADAPIQLLEEIQVMRQHHAPPMALAGAYCTLGRLYRDRVEQGDRQLESLLVALLAHKTTLDLLDNQSPLWVEVANDLGNLYWMLSRRSSEVDAVAALVQAIYTYQQGLQCPTGQSRAMLLSNLGAAYSDLAQHQDSEANLQQAITAYQDALQHCSFEAEPARYAATQNNLGTTYWNLAQYSQPAVYLAQAIAAYREALRYYTADQEPVPYAMIQTNLGTAYWNLTQCSPASLQEIGLTVTPEVLLRRAIAAYRSALPHRTPETAPTAYAATQNNLGTAYWHLATQATLPATKRVDLLQRAIAAYTATLKTVHGLGAEPPPLTFDPVATQNNLGTVYGLLAADTTQFSLETRFQHWVRSLSHHLAAVQHWQTKPDLRQPAMNAASSVVQKIYQTCGAQGQAIALSKVPANLLPELLQRRSAG
jgi:tetratricopeptide (TPR) repeat protein